MMRHVILVLAGMTAGMAIAVSCSDGSPATVDAAVNPPPADGATCECAAAEPPIAGRIVTANNVLEIPANDDGAQSAVCPTGSQLLTGSCTVVDIFTLHDLTLQQSGIAERPNVWICAFRNHEAAPVTIRAQVTCLQSVP